jgi:hypothetical protein
MTGPVSNIMRIWRRKALHGSVLQSKPMKLASATAVTDPRLGLDVERLFSGDPDILQAAAQIDRSLIQLALARPLRERLRAGVALARLASRFRA